MEGAVAPVVAWRKKVSQRKAPGAMRAIALLVKPVRPSVACICGAFVSSAMNCLLVISRLLLCSDGLPEDHVDSCPLWAGKCRLRIAPPAKAARSGACTFLPKEDKSPHDPQAGHRSTTAILKSPGDSSWQTRQKHRRCRPHSA